MKKEMLQAAVALLLPLSLSGQSSPPPLIEKVDVALVNVDVTVTSEGAPLAGLTIDDFEILEDGKPQTIRGFSAIENARVKLAREGASASTPEDVTQFRRKVVVLIDNNTVSKIQRDSALRHLRGFIQDDFNEDYEWSIATVGQEVRTFQGFTTNKSELISALDRVMRTPTFELLRQADRRLLNDPVRTRVRDGEFASGYDFGETARFQARENTMRTFQLMQKFATAVVQTCRAYTSSEGKKVLLLITGGLDINTRFAAYDNGKDRNMDEMRRAIEGMVGTVVREANAASFNVHVINSRGLESVAAQHDVINRTTGLSSNVNDAAASDSFGKDVDISDNASISLSLALGTGGRHMPGNDFRSSVETVDTLTSNFYSLAYTPSHPEDDGYHRVDVKVKRRGVTVEHRQGYLHASTERQLERSLQAPMTFAKDKGTLPVELTLLRPKDARARPAVIPVRAAMPMSKLTLFPRDGKFVGRVHVYLSVYDEKGKNVGFHHQIQDISLSESEMAALGETAFRYTMNVELKSGTYTLAITLRDEISDAIGTGIQELRL